MTATLETERVGKFEFDVACSERTNPQWERRAEALTNWLLAEWERSRMGQRACLTSSAAKPAHL